MVDTNQPIQYFLSKIGGQLEVIALSVALFFAPIGGILITVFAFIMLDTVLGIWKSRKKGKPITSRGLSALASKTFLYHATILVTYLVDYFILNSITVSLFSQEMLVTKVIALTLMGIEVVSINENFKIVRGISLWEAMKKLFSRAQDMKEDLKKTIK